MKSFVKSCCCALGAIACGGQAEPANAPPPLPPAAPVTHPEPGIALSAVADGDAIVVRSARAAERVEIRFPNGTIVPGSTDDAGIARIQPSEPILFDNAWSSTATVAVGPETTHIDIQPLVDRAKRAAPAAWVERLAAHSADQKKADAAISFAGTIYHDKGGDLVESCLPAGSEICFDGIDNDCNGRYDDEGCGYGSGAMQWTLVWKGPADLDLHVISPDGVDVFAGHPANVAAGLTLDRECTGAASGVVDCPSGNVENVTSNDAPMTGTYIAYAEVNHSHATEPIHARLSGRLGERTWYASITLAPFEGAIYRVAYPVGGDTDRDLVVDEHDSCPEFQGCYFEDPAYRGCPDKDKDGVPDAVDACPDKAGLDQQDPRAHGCPIKFGGAWVTNGGVTITQKLEFAFGKADLTPASQKLLIDVAAAVKAQPASVKKLAVDGHTDPVGSELFNMDLSMLRAGSVFTELVRLGVPSKLLLPRGFGETSPIFDNDTPEGREKNRRVEFVVVDPKATGPECFF